METNVKWVLDGITFSKHTEKLINIALNCVICDEL